MKIQATIKVINESKSGTSMVTGIEWVSQRIHIGWEEPIDQEGNARQQLLIVRLRDKDVQLFAERGYKKGDTIAGNLNCYLTKSKTGYYNNDLVFELD